MRPVTGASPGQETTARLNGRPVAGVVQAHRRWTAADYTIPSRLAMVPTGAALGGEPELVLVTVTAPVNLSLDDAAAVLFNSPRQDLTDDDTVRYLIASAVVSGGCLQVEELRCQLGEAAPGPGYATQLAYCRQRAAAVFARPDRRNTAQHRLVQAPSAPTPRGAGSPTPIPRAGSRTG